MSKNKIIKSGIKNLLPERSNTNFTYTNERKKQFDWENGAVNRFSSYHVRPGTITNAAHAVKTATELVKRYIPGMQLPKNTRIVLDPNQSSVGIDNVIKLSVKMMQDESIDVNERIDIFLGEFLHETCHIKYTDWKPLKYAIDKKQINATEKTISNSNRKEASSDKIALQPNPAQNTTTLVLPKGETMLAITIVDNKGVIVWKRSAAVNNTNINTASWASGEYYVIVREADKKAITQKLIIQH